MSLIRNVTLEDGAQLDAFSRLRVSEPETILSYSNRYDDNELLWEHSLTGGGTNTHLPDEAAIRLRVASSGDRVIRQTRAYHPYQPGKSQFIKITTVVGAAVSNVQKDVGYYDEENGIFLRQTTAGVLQWAQRSSTSGSAVTTTVNQSSWNIDPLDGSGPSGITLDITKAQILVIDLQWLGVGRVRVGFDIDGIVYYAHEFLNANSKTTVYMTTATLPVRYDINATGVPGSTADLIAICSTVESEGGFEIADSLEFGASNGVTTRGVTAPATLGVISIRPKATFNSITNRGRILVENFGVYTDGDGFVELVYNPTLGGTPSWSSANADSIVEFDVAGTTVSGGITIAAAYVSSAAGPATQSLNARVASRLPLTLDISGANPIHMTVKYTPIGAGTDNVAAFIQWREIR